jgi:hypothetical protein
MAITRVWLFSTLQKGHRTSDPPLIDTVYSAWVPAMYQRYYSYGEGMLHPLSVAPEIEITNYGYYAPYSYHWDLNPNTGVAFTWDDILFNYLFGPLMYCDARAIGGTPGVDYQRSRCDQVWIVVEQDEEPTYQIIRPKGDTLDGDPKEYPKVYFSDGQYVEGEWGWAGIGWPWWWRYETHAYWFNNVESTTYLGNTIATDQITFYGKDF